MINCFSHRAIFRAALLFIALVAPAFTAFADQAPTAYPSSGGIAAKLQPFVDKGVIPGAVVLVADKDKILDLETVGYSDFDKKIPMDTNALFMICSMTKTVTAVGLMMLVDEGKVNLDDPVEKYLPAFKGQMVVDPKDPAHPHPPQHPITVREVMSHTSGIKHEVHFKNPKTTVDAANQIAQQPLDWEPGSKYLYSLGPVIGGAIIEVASGTPYPDFIKQRILDPLDMKDSTFWPNDEQASHLAITAQYNAVDQKLEDIHWNEAIIKDPVRRGQVPSRVLSQATGEVLGNYANHYARPSSDLFSTTLDFAKFSQMLLNNGTFKGRQYITPASVKEMATIQTKDLFPNKSLGYGIGAFVQKVPSQDGPTPGSFGHSGARKTIFWVDPADNLVLIFMTQKCDLKKEDQKALSIAFVKTAIEKYKEAGNASAIQASAASN